MKKLLRLTLGLLALGALAVGSTPADAQTVAPGPYYATPSWDQTLACTALNACPRFIVLSNMGSTAVLDRETGLVWERSPDMATFGTWQNAQTHCNQTTVFNRKGWRLPTLQELASLVDPSVPTPGPTLPPGHPFSNVLSNWYWSATTSATDSGLAWFVWFFNGGVLSQSKGNNSFVWCVRGGHGVDPQ
jgi:hypothetical protein